MDALVSRPCPICQQPSSKLVAEQNLDTSKLDAFAYASRKVPELMHLRLVLCEPCDLLFADPAPHSDALHHAYEQAAFDSSTEERYAARTYANALPGDIHPTSALDIGCGGGQFLAELQKRGVASITGVEPSPMAAQTAPTGVREHIRVAMFNANDFTDKKFSLVSSFQTLEHVSDPLALLSGARALLEPNGAVYVVAHNRKGFVNRVLGKSSPIYDIEHLQLFSPHSLQRIMEQAGLHNVRVSTLWNTYPLAYWVRLLPLPLSFKKTLTQILSATRLGTIPICLPVGNMAAVGYHS